MSKDLKAGEETRLQEQLRHQGEQGQAGLASHQLPHVPLPILVGVKPVDTTKKEWEIEEKLTTKVVDLGKNRS